MYRILGLDLSLTETGFCVIDFDGKFDVLKDKGLIKTKLKGVERLEYLENSLKYLIKEFKPDIAILEGYAMGIRGGRTFNIGEWGGIARLTLFKKKVKYLSVSPKSLKKYATGNGNSDKNMMLKTVFQKWGFDATDDNVADAFALAKVGSAIYQVDNNMPNVKLRGYEIEALEKIERKMD